jgi:hypothetical protein
LKRSHGSRRDSPLDAAAPIGIWFNNAEATQWAIQDGMLFGPRYIGSVEVYKKERRCYNCQTLGHEVWSCRERKRCGHYTAENDKREFPPESMARGADCNGNHPTGSKECQRTGHNNGRRLQPTTPGMGRRHGTDSVPDGLPASSRGPGTPYQRDKIPGIIPVTERSDPIAW